MAATRGRPALVLAGRERRCEGAQNLVSNPLATPVASRSPGRPASARPRPSAPARPEPTAQASGLAFALFIVLNAVLFIRPAEIVPALLGLPVYEVTILSSLALSAKAVVRRLSPAALADNPITVCVLGLLAAVVLSHLCRLSFGMAKDAGTMFLKVVIYYLLFVATVDTVGRLKQFCLWMVLFVFVLTALALLQYHGYIDIPSLTAMDGMERSIDEVTGELVTRYTRLCSTGIYNNPNDLSRILVEGIFLALFFVLRPRGGLARWLCLAALPVFGYALALTQSRGGFLGFLAGLAILLRVRYGLGKGLALAAVVVPVVLVAFGGRQTEMDTSGGTAQKRIQLWSQGLILIRESPLFGIGVYQYYERAGQVAHNSFMHGYTELGYFGGTCFVATFVTALWGLYRVSVRRQQVSHADVRALAPYLAAVVASYVVGMFSSSRNYVAPTYTVVALGAACLGVTRAYTALPLARFNGRYLLQQLVVGVFGLAAIYVFVRISVHH
jgi:hypothetical protein